DLFRSRRASQLFDDLHVGGPTIRQAAEQGRETRCRQDEPVGPVRQSNRDQKAVILDRASRWTRFLRVASDRLADTAKNVDGDGFPRDGDDGGRGAERLGQLWNEPLDQSLDAS